MNQKHSSRSARCQPLCYCTTIYDSIPICTYIYVSNTKHVKRLKLLLEALKLPIILHVTREEWLVHATVARVLTLGNVILSVPVRVGDSLLGILGNGDAWVYSLGMPPCVVTRWDECCDTSRHVVICRNIQLHHAVMPLCMVSYMLLQHYIFTTSCFAAPISCCY